ncbi:hypothetical protein B0T14DRAFT_518273 [Immersiella caudata]|uniref:Uncharacterized protein n=1 Tax=Immersiella caudata TaxID=314043 RepID=A0AA39WPC7_9PEZI|nr:hypothetical protein B0T14DRAFT_518273 [Immersiella caudata]
MAAVQSQIGETDGLLSVTAVRGSVSENSRKLSRTNNPKLFETVEDAIRRLILPELTALKWNKVGVPVLIGQWRRLSARSRKR